MEGLELFPIRSYEHISHEQGMIGTGADDSNIDSVSLIPASEAIDDINSIPGVEIVDSAFSDNSPDLPRNIRGKLMAFQLLKRTTIRNWRDWRGFGGKAGG